MKKVILILWVIVFLSGCATYSKEVIAKSNKDPRQITGRILIDPISRRVYVPQHIEGNSYLLHERIDRTTTNFFK